MNDKIEDFVEILIHKIAYMLPAKLVAQCAIRVLVHATSGDYSTEDLTTMPAAVAIRRWYRDRRIK